MATYEEYRAERHHVTVGKGQQVHIAKIDMRLENYWTLCGLGPSELLEDEFHAVTGEVTCKNCIRQMKAKEVKGDGIDKK